MNYFLPLIGVFCIAVALAAFMYVKRTAKPTNARPDATEVSHPVTPPDAPPRRVGRECGDGGGSTSLIQSSDGREPSAKSVVCLTGYSEW